jgi:hypothetical protein
MLRELYVYYRVPVHAAEALRRAVSEMQDRLRCEFPGLQARLLRRTDQAGVWDTWMETYAMPSAADTGGVSDALRVTIEQQAADWRHLCDGPRHTEVFDASA